MPAIDTPKVMFDEKLFMDILHVNHFTVTDLTDKNSPNYIGCGRQHVYSCCRKGYMSRALYNRIMKIIDISECCLKTFTFEEMVRDYHDNLMKSR